MHNFLRKVHSIARKNPRKIVFPEGTEERILKATEEILAKKKCNSNIGRKSKNNQE